MNYENYTIFRDFYTDSRLLLYVMTYCRVKFELGTDRTATPDEMFDLGAKALAIPKHPAVHNQKPSEMDPSRQILKLIWPKGKSAGTLRHKDSGEVYFLLVSKANIPADRSVLPTEAAMQDAATKAMGFL